MEANHGDRRSAQPSPDLHLVVRAAQPQFGDFVDVNGNVIPPPSGPDALSVRWRAKSTEVGNATVRCTIDDDNDPKDDDTAPLVAGSETGTRNDARRKEGNFYLTIGAPQLQMGLDRSDICAGG